jgi:hypothetical protein
MMSRRVQESLKLHEHVRISRICHDILKSHVFLIMVKNFTQLLSCDFSSKQDLVVCSFPVKVLVDSGKKCKFEKTVRGNIGSSHSLFEALCYQCILALRHS